MARRSLPQSPEAFILTSTWPCPGSGRSNSQISTRSCPDSITPRITAPSSPRGGPKATPLRLIARLCPGVSFPALPLHRPGGEAPDHVAQREHRDDELGDDGEHHAGCHRAPLDLLEGDELQEANGYDLGSLRGQDQGEDEVVPGVDERQYAARREPRQGYPGDYHAEAGEPAPPVYLDGLLKLFGHVFQEGAHHPHHQREGDELVDQDQADVGVVEPEGLVDHEQGQKYDQLRREPEREERESEVLLEAEVHPR